MNNNYFYNRLIANRGVVYMAGGGWVVKRNDFTVDNGGNTNIKIHSLVPLGGG